VESARTSSASVLLLALGARDPALPTHSRAVASLTQRVAGAMGFRSPQLAFLAGLMHDVGKVGVPDAVLTKAGPLTFEEWEVMKGHPEIGARILAPLTWATPLLDVVRAHHENFDGSGYPHGRRGSDIPFLARVLRVVDSYEAMTDERPYRPALAPMEALGEIGDASGRSFDPLVVDAFLGVMTQSVISLEPEFSF
jgi:putative nucleotidyltransferase with HDIG domain